MLVEDEVVHLPFSLIGSTDKITVRFTLAQDGVPVRGGSVNVLMDEEGDLISIASRTAPGVGELDTHPVVDGTSRCPT
jgi:hypothetical protein